jgi:hypothetical protein
MCDIPVMFALTALRRHLARKHSTNFKCDKEGCNKTFAKQYQVCGSLIFVKKFISFKLVLRIVNDLFRIRILTIHTVTVLGIRIRMFWASRIHLSKVWIRIRLWIRILPFSHKGVERTERLLANKILTLNI